LAQSVKLSDEIMALVRKESDLQSRSVAGQITHWVRIGRAIEKSGNFDHQRVTAALEASLAPEELSQEEHEVWVETFAEQMAEPSDRSRDYFARRRQLGLGVGMSESGEIIREPGDR
jgi:hypothetical protein